MTSFNEMREELDDIVIAERVGNLHDDARAGYALPSNRVKDFDEFSRVIGEYYNHHFSTCVSHGGRLSASDAMGKAKEILTQEYRRKGGDIVSAFNDCHKGTNGGLRVVLDTIAERMKAEAVEIYTRDVFDRHVTPNSWDQKVKIIRQFIESCGAQLRSSIDAEHPERYASNYEELIRAYVSNLERTSSMFRRL